jgi:alkyl hydroperoxide reductase subunit AhpF
MLSDRVREQLRLRFESGLHGPVHMKLYIKPGSARLILPAGVGCATCQDAREIVEALRDAAPEKLTLEVIDITREGAQASEITDVPTILVSSSTAGARIRFQGLPAGTEFPALVDAVERVSRNDHGLSEISLGRLAKLTEPMEVMVFATPT